MRLVIKGSPKNAKREASRHGIPLRNCRVTKLDNERTPTTMCDAPDSARTRVAQWFNVSGTIQSGRGYAPGSLLFFNGARGRRKRRRRR